MFVLALQAELRINESRSLKAKRSVIRSIVEGARSRFGVAASEVDHHDFWGRSALGFAAVGPTADHVVHVIDEVERFVWSHPEIEVIGTERRWAE
jgi:uncharacterized protein YlxP (DUF503 family)